MQVSKGRGLALKLELTDILDNGLDDHVLIELADTRSSRRYRNQEQVQRALILSGIRSSPSALYRVLIAPRRYRPRQFFVSLKEGETPGRKIAFPVEPGKVAGIQAAPYSRLAPALQRLLSEITYASLAPLQKACLLNLAAKAAATILGGAACLDHWLRILSVQQDRLLVRTSAALEKAAALSPLFVSADALLHAAPAGYRRTRSFKTKDPTAVCSSLVSGARSRSKIIWWTPISTRPKAWSICSRSCETPSGDPPTPTTFERS